MKYLILILLFSLSAPIHAYQHLHSSPADTWAKDSLERYQATKAFIPIAITNQGENMSYYLEVNNQPVTDVFILQDGESVSLDVPIQLKDQQGGQLFKVCSVSLADISGARICSNVELFNLYASEPI